MAGVPTWGYYKYYLLHGTSIETEIEKCRCKCRTYNHQCKRGWILFKSIERIIEGRFLEMEPAFYMVRSLAVFA